MRDRLPLVELTQTIRVVYADREYSVPTGRKGEVIKDNLTGDSVVARFVVDDLNMPVDFDLYPMQFTRIE